MRRRPAVAGQFYSGTAKALREQVERYLVPSAVRTKALGIVSPHAGLMYSGAVAGAVYSSIRLPETFVLLGPNHTGLGAAVSLMTDGSWETPLGSVEIDSTLARSILSNSRRIQEDPLAHLHEHSLEVQLPFIQCLKNQFKIVPIQMLDTRLETCIEIGKAVAKAIADCGLRIADSRSERQANQNVLIVASSDMTHYEDAASAREKDNRAIRCILDRDAEGLYRTVREYGITMCGYGPVTAMLAACNQLGAVKAELIKYSNSGDVSGDYDQVVGYAGVVVS